MRAPLPRPSALDALALVLAAALVATFVAPDRFRPVGEPTATTRADMDALRAALETYRYDTGHYPTTAQGLAALVREPTSPRPWNWRGPYLLRPIPTDPWGSAYVYRRDEEADGDGYRLSSYGADRTPGGQGGDADVTVHP